MTLREMQDERNALLAQARKIQDKADEEKRELTAEEADQFKRIMDDWTDVDRRIDERQKREESLRKAEERVNEPGKAIVGNRDQPGDGDGDGDGQDKEQRAVFAKFLRNGVNALASQEVRALQADSDTAGGFVVAPEQFVASLIQAVDDLVFIRPLATKYRITKAEALGVPKLAADPADADWTSELAVGSEDTTMAFGKRELHPHPLAKLIKVSNKLIQQAAIDPEGLVRDRLAYKFGITEEKAFLTGDGAGQPLGVFTASASGISTGRDYSTGNEETSMTFDGLIGAKFTLKQQYLGKARWAFHRDGVSQIAKLKDGEGQYIWRESVRVGEPDRLLGIPVMMSEYVPNTFTTGKYVGIIGDFSQYWIADALDMQIQRLVELFAATNQVGFIGRREVDGQPVLEEAFVRVKLA